MLKKTSRLAIANAIYLVLLGNLAAADQPTVARPADPLYESVADEVYLQEVGERIPTDRPVTSIAAQRGEVHAVVDKKLYQLVEGQLHAIDKAPSGWRKLYALQGRLWGTAEDGVYRIDAESSSFDKVFDAPMVDLCVHNGELYGATSSDVFRFVDEEFVNIEPSSGWLSSDSTVWKADGTQVLADPVRIGPIRRMASYSGTLYLLLPGGPRLLSGPIFETDPVDWGTMPSDQLRDMRAQGSRLYFATDRGVAVLRGAALTTIAGPDGLPFEDATCLTPGASRDLWIGTTRGAVRKMGRAYQYFGADHWLPGEHVHEIAVDGSQVLIATDKGIGVIRYEPFTLRKKAEYFLRSVQQGGHQRLGFVHRLYWDHAGQRWLREISDNDGGHTAHYLAAMCFKYAVTGDEAARREAQEAFEAMRWLQTITETDGFFARSIWAVDVDQGGRGTRGSGGLPAKWYPTKDGKWLWKGDTSSALP